MAKAKIVDSADIVRKTRKAPATRLIESLPEGLMTARDVSERFEVNIETIRRLARLTDDKGNRKFKAPSKAAKSGDLVIWCYTPEDVEELAEYFGEREPKRKGRKR